MEYVDKLSLTIAPTNRTADLIVDLNQDLTSNPYVEIILKKFKGGSYRTIFQYEMNICHIFGRQSSINLVSAWINNFLKNGNLPKSCPIKRVSKVAITKFFFLIFLEIYIF